MAAPQYMYAAVDTGYIYVSDDGGTTWTEKTTPGSKAWRKIRCSNSGQYVLAMARNQNYWYSDDFGDTWKEVSVSRDWRGCDVSGNGNTMIIGSFDGNSPRISIDYGTSWANSNAGTNNTDLSVDEDGTNLIRANYGNYMEISTNSDASWSDTTGAGSRNWRECAMDDDGSNAIGIYDGGDIYYTTSGGSSWTAAGVSMTWATKAAISGDGTTMIGVADGKSHISTDSGASWTSDASSESWQDIVVNTDGSYLLGARTKSGASYPHISDDGGATWTALTGAGSRTWKTVAFGQPVSTISDPSYYFKLDGNANEEVVGNDGTINGATLSATAISGSSYDFDGANDTMTCPRIDDWVSFSMWVQVGSTSPVNEFIIDNRDAAGTRPGFTFYINASGQLQITNDIGASSQTINTTGLTWSTGTWYHLVVVIDQTYGNRIYRNGVNIELATNTVTGSSLQNGTDSSTYFGDAKSGGFAFDGIIDEIGIWNVALTANEVYNLYNGGTGSFYPFSTPSGWSGTINGVSSPSKINGVLATSISSVNGV